MRALGESIRAARMRKGLTQEALAELLDITPIHLKNMESSRRNPSVPLLFALMELLDKGEPLPFPVEGSALYYVGPTPERPGEVIGSAGPTTSGRMDAYSPRLLDLGQAIMIGKGARNQAVKDAVVRNGAVYLAALGGAGALMAASVKKLEIICWEDLGCEAVRRLEVEDMPLTVILDPHGGDLYQSGPAAYLASLEEK